MKKKIKRLCLFVSDKETGQDTGDKETRGKETKEAKRQRDKKTQRQKTKRLHLFVHHPYSSLKMF